MCVCESVYVRVLVSVYARVRVLNVHATTIRFPHRHEADGGLCTRASDTVCVAVRWLDDHFGFVSCHVI